MKPCFFSKKAKYNVHKLYLMLFKIILFLKKSSLACTALCQCRVLCGK